MGSPHTGVIRVEGSRSTGARGVTVVDASTSARLGQDGGLCAVVLSPQQLWQLGDVGGDWNGKASYSLLSSTTIAGSKRSACLLCSENKPSSAGFCSAFDFRGCGSSLGKLSV